MPIDIARNIDKFLEGRTPLERYASFDYCFNYFQSFRENDCIETLAEPDNIQMSCLQLGFYLASWGMYRGSSFILKKSVKFYKPLIKKIAEFNREIWDIDVDTYNEENIELLLDCKKMIIDSLGQGTDTLISKIMLGVFGNVPAFDTYFCKGLHFCSLGKKPLKKISEFYENNKDEIDRHCIHTLDFKTGRVTDMEYTKAKLIDMVGFIKGWETLNQLT